MEAFIQTIFNMKIENSDISFITLIKFDACFIFMVLIFTNILYIVLSIIFDNLFLEGDNYYFK